MYKHLFGPVPSRRLGMSLGVDMVPKKVCSLDCIYCEVGKTTSLTAERAEYVPAHEIIAELEDFFKIHPDPEVITFSGYGEPTLNSAIGQVIDFIKSIRPHLPLALLTNGTLLFDKQVRKEILKVDYILPSLDAATEEVFQKINRPDSSLDLQAYIKALAHFRKDFAGQMWLEVFVVPGYNDTTQELDLLKEAILEINPHKVQLNTLDRPGTEGGIRSATCKELESIREYWDLPHLEIVSAVDRKTSGAYREDVENVIKETLVRRPCTLDDLSLITGLHVNEINKYLDVMEAEGIVQTERQDRGLFYKMR
ncbi:MAG: radical SAM protein [Bacteroidales bacterium]|jgi:wyosine [tRNA(Phe)-imidazoG37] synthetase (radical SAM superfamily)|nr:radical SAM protein [Bacteroidales bacterium]